MSGFSSGGPDLHTSVPSASLLGAVQQAVIAVASAWSARYFVAHVGSGPRGRRLAAGLLALLFVAVALEAVAGLPVADTSAEVWRRTPLLLATTGIAFLVSYRPRAAR